MKHLLSIIFILIFSFAAYGQTGCAYTLSQNLVTVGNDFGTAITVNVTAADGCAWTAVSNDNWISVAGGTNGTGNGTVQIYIATGFLGGNYTRSGTVAIAGQTFNVNQRYNCSPGGGLGGSRSSAPASGGVFQLNLTAIPGCRYLFFNEQINPLYFATVNLQNMTATYQQNFGPARSAVKEIRFAGTDGRTVGLLLTLDQSSGCAYTPSKTSESFSGAAATGSFTVQANGGCPWQTVSNNDWITIDVGQSWSGSGTVGYSVAANPGAARTGTITVGGQTFTINQAGVCTYLPSKTSESFSAAAGNGSFTIETVAGCQWQAVSQNNWITVNVGQSWSGNGTVGYSVAANTGAARTGTIVAGGQPFTISQAGSCAYSVNLTSQSFTSSGGIGNVTVTTEDGCAWSPSSNDAWITVTEGANGSGNGTVTFTVAQNKGAARTGTVFVAGQTFTVSQAKSRRTRITAF